MSDRQPQPEAGPEPHGEPDPNFMAALLGRLCAVLVDRGIVTTEEMDALVADAMDTARRKGALQYEDARRIRPLPIRPLVPGEAARLRPQAGIADRPSMRFKQ